VQTASFVWPHSWNTQFPEPTISLELRTGIGYTGTLLGSVTVSSIPDSTPDWSWVDFNFANPIPLVANSSYTLHWVVLNEGVEFVSGTTVRGVPYAGGDRLNSMGVVDPNIDWAFRVLVPEPGTSILLTMGFFGLCLSLVRHR